MHACCARRGNARRRRPVRSAGQHAARAASRAARRTCASSTRSTRRSRSSSRTRRRARRRHRHRARTAQTFTRSVAAGAGARRSRSRSMTPRSPTSRSTAPARRARPTRSRRPADRRVPVQPARQRQRVLERRVAADPAHGVRHRLLRDELRRRSIAARRRPATDTTTTATSRSSRGRTTRRSRSRRRPRCSASATQAAIAGGHADDVHARTRSRCCTLQAAVARRSHGHADHVGRTHDDVRRVRRPRGDVLRRDHAARPARTRSGPCCADHLEEMLFPTLDLGQDVRDRAQPEPRHERARHAADHGAEARHDDHVHARRRRRARAARSAPGEFCEVKIQVDTAIVATEPVLVGHYLQSAIWRDPFFGESVGEGDPSMAIAVPVEQYRNDYTVLVPAAYAKNFLSISAPSIGRGARRWQRRSR